jgi:hypothetical protein
MLLSHSNTEDDAQIVINSADIVEGIKELTEDYGAKDTKFVSGIRTDLQIGETLGDMVNFEDLKSYLYNYGAFGEMATMQFNS